MVIMTYFPQEQLPGMTDIDLALQTIGQRHNANAIDAAGIEVIQRDLWIEYQDRVLGPGQVCLNALSEKLLTSPFHATGSDIWTTDREHLWRFVKHETGITDGVVQITTDVVVEPFPSKPTYDNKGNIAKNADVDEAQRILAYPTSALSKKYSTILGVPVSGRGSKRSIDQKQLMMAFKREIISSARLISVNSYAELLGAYGQRSNVLNLVINPRDLSKKPEFCDEQHALSVLGQVRKTHGSYTPESAETALRAMEDNQTPIWLRNGKMQAVLDVLKGSEAEVFGIE